MSCSRAESWGLHMERMWAPCKDSERKDNRDGAGYTLPHSE